MTPAEFFAPLLWQGALVGLAAAVALRLAGAAASRARYRLALGALALIAVAPIVTVARRAGVLGEWGLLSAASSETTPTIVRPDPKSPPAGMQAAQPSPLPPSPGRRPDLLTWLGALWAVGVMAFLVRLGGAVVQVHRIRASTEPAPPWLGELARELEAALGIRRTVPVLVSRHTDSPFACGVLRPAVVLPAALQSGLSRDAIRVVLAHELAHVRRRDYAVNLAQRLLEAFGFFHPAVHWLSRIARDEREHCCDELTAAVVRDRRVVAGALLALEEARGTFAAGYLLPAAGGGPLLRRVERLLVRVPVAGPRWSLASLLVLVTGGATMVLATPASRSAGSGGDLVWSGELHAGQRLRVRNLAGPIRVVRVAGSIGRIHAAAARMTSALTFPATRNGDGVTVCALRAEHGRCDAEGYTWFGPPEAMGEARIALTVELPAGVSVTAATFDGDLELDGVDADAEARTGSGTVRIALPPGYRGRLESRLSNGRVISPQPPDEWLRQGRHVVRVASGNGDLILTQKN